MRLRKPKFWDQKQISFWSILLLPISLIYSTISILKKIFNKEKRFTIPVICVGNIYLGGTGKTPLVKKIFNISKSLNKNPAFIKKNYDYLLDEINMLKETGTTFLCDKRRLGIISSIKNNHDVVILDDGFQDFSIKPNFSILCFNSKQLIGNGFIIPSGPLRENLKATSRADCIVINGEKNYEFESKLKSISNKTDLHIFYSKYKINNLEEFLDKEITAFAGIGNPSNFFDLLRENNLNLKYSYSFPDHHNYSQKDLDKINKDKSTIKVTTEKDYYRMPEEQKKNYYQIKVELIIENEDEFIKLIKKNI